MRSRLNEMGATLIEVMVASGVIITLALAVGQQSISLKRFKVRQRTLDARAMMVQSLVDQFRARAEIFPKSFMPTSQYPSDLTALVTHLQSQGPNAWSYHWDQEYLGSPSACPTCPGRAHAIIEQMKVCSNPNACPPNSPGDQTEHYLGIYKVRLVLYHPTLFAQSPHAEEHFFTVVSK